MKGMLLVFLLFIQALFLEECLASTPLVLVPSGNFKPFWLTNVAKNKLDKKLDTNIFVSSFEVMIHQVTVGEFKKFLLAHPEWKKDQVSSLFVDEAYLQNIEQNKTIKNSLPMTSVSWFAARAYCQSLEMRLPTINEWEYMASASETHKEASLDEKFLQRILNWYGEPQGSALKSVKSIYKNLYGVWDLHGLVWEWVADFNSSFVTGESREDSALNKDLFCGAGNINGGNKENYAAFMRFAFRSSLKGTSSIWNLGFRCVRSK